MRPLLLFMSNSLERCRQSILFLLSLLPSPPGTFDIFLAVVVPSPTPPTSPPPLRAILNVKFSRRSYSFPAVLFLSAVYTGVPAMFSLILK